MTTKPANIYAALLEVQKRLKPAKRNASAETFDYADLKSVIDTVRPLLLRYGFLTIQKPSGAMHGAVFMASVETQLVYTLASQTVSLGDTSALLGDTFSNNVSCPCSPSPEKYGAAITMLRRYGLAALVGLVQEEQGADFPTMSRAHSIVEQKRREATNGPEPVI